MNVPSAVQPYAGTGRGLARSESIRHPNCSGSTCPCTFATDISPAAAMTSIWRAAATVVANDSSLSGRPTTGDEQHRDEQHRDEQHRDEGESSQSTQRPPASAPLSAAAWA